MLTITPVRYCDLMNSPHFGELIREYSAECSIPEIGETCPQSHIYEGMETAGMMHSFGVYDRENLVGFAILLLFVLPHYGKKIANVESLFLSKLSRRGGFGLELMGTLEEFARKNHCCGMLYNVRVGSELELLFSKRARYLRTNSVFLRSFA